MRHRWALKGGAGKVLASYNTLYTPANGKRHIVFYQTSGKTGEDLKPTFLKELGY